VVINGVCSSSEPVLSGVPQGSVLGPLLFLIYVDELACLPLSDGSQCVLYADDLLLFRPVKDHMDIQCLQNDISSVEEWVQHNYLTLNTSKCKSMIVSRKKSQPYPSTLTLGGQRLEQVESFKYLGVLLSSNLSFSQHIQTICAKARKILGLLYRRFYKNTSNEALLQLYISLVRPHLEYASPVWNPYLKKDIKQLEDVEKFALKMITMQWDLGYQDLLRISDISSLQSRRVQSSLCTLFKIVHGLCYCPPNFVTPRQNYSERTNRQLLLQQPYARTNHYLFSFVPHTVQAWNKLPESVVTLPLNSFKHRILCSNL